MNFKGPVYQKSFEFGLMAIELTQILKQQRHYELANQFLRSATSVGANVQEAGSAVSRKDFINRMSISLKEARESLYWLSLFKASRLIDLKTKDAIQLCEELIRILTSIVKTTKHGPRS